MKPKGGTFLHLAKNLFRENKRGKEGGKGEPFCPCFLSLPDFHRGKPVRKAFFAGVGSAGDQALQALSDTGGVVGAYLLSG